MSEPIRVGRPADAHMPLTRGSQSVPVAACDGRLREREGGAADAASDFADLLGVGVQERDAARIIMAAQLRLRLLRQSQPPRCVRNRARQIMQARDVLLRSAVQACGFSTCPK